MWKEPQLLSLYGFSVSVFAALSQHPACGSAPGSEKGILAHVQCKDSISPVTFLRDFIQPPLSHAFISFLFLPSVLDLSSCCFWVTNLLGQKHLLAAGLHLLQASPKIQELGHITVWNRNQRLLGVSMLRNTQISQGLAH